MDNLNKTGEKLRVTVFGGTGFLGSHVVDALYSSGCEVVVFDRVKSPFLRDGQKMYIGDILDEDMVENVVVGSEVVYNFAGVADIKAAGENPLETIKTNIIGNTNILEACRKHAVKRFVFASTVYVYSELASFYRSSKQACELIIESYQKKFGLEYTILRYGSLYGPRATKTNFIYKVIEQSIKEGRITRKGDGREIRDYIHVIDAAQCSIKILNDDYKNQHVLITGTQTIRIKDLLEMIKEIMSPEIVIEYVPRCIEDHYEITPYCFKPRSAKKLILENYHDLGQGILECIYDINSRLNPLSQDLADIKKQLY